MRALRHPVAVLAVGWGLLLVGWSMSNPPFAAPDEPAHYLRAVAVGGGSVRATPIVKVPAGLWAVWLEPGGTNCNAGQRGVPADCIESYRRSTRPVHVETAAGGYPPPAYLLPGLALRAADDPSSATRTARLAVAALALAFLVLAAVLLYSAAEPLLSLVGLVAAVTPMVLFVGASISNSGLEVGAGIAFIAALLRLTRERSRPAWVWASAVVSAGALVSSRTTGVLWIVLDLALGAALLWAGRTRAGGRDLRRPLLLLAGVAVLGVVANRIWEGAYGWTLTQRGAIDYTSTGDQLTHAFQQLRRILDEQMGVFGWLDAPMPHAAYPAAQAVLAALVATAFLVAVRRERFVLGGTILAYLATIVALSASLVAATATDVQGRHVLAFAAAVPLLAGELLLRHRAKLALASPRLIAGAIVIATAGLHVLAWLSVGTSGPLFFFDDPVWAPPLGWAVWAVVTVAGAALVAAAPTLARASAT